MSADDLTTDEIAPLLDFVAREQDSTLRYAACTALAHLPLADDAWEAAAPFVKNVELDVADVAVDPVASDDRLGPALAAAKTGKRAPLAELLAISDGVDPPRLFWGSPWRAYDALAAYRPLPGDVTDWLVHQLKDETLGRNANLMIWSLTGVADANGDPPATDEPPSATAEEAAAIAEQLLTNPLSEISFENLDALGALDAERAADVAGWVLTEARRLGAGRAFDAYSDKAMDVIAHLPPSGLEIGDIYTISRRGPRPILGDDQLAWIAARSGPQRTVTELAPLVESTSATTGRLELLDLIGDSVRTISRRPPMLRPTADPSPGGWSVRGRRVRGPRTTADVVLESADIETDPAESRTAWPHLLCDDEVVVDTPFPVEVGLRADELADVGGTGAMSVPTEEFELDVEFSIDGFTVVIGTPRFPLTAGPEEPYPVVTVTLKATRDEALKPDRVVGVSFFVDDTLRGYAHRVVRVVESEAQLGQGEPPVAAPADTIDASERLENDADVTIVVSHGDDVAGTRLLWTARSRVAGIGPPPSGMYSDIGAEPRRFARDIIDSASTAQDPLALFDLLTGQGMQIAAHIPAPIRSMLAGAVEAADDRAATVLIHSAEPYVPWELAVVEELPGHGDENTSPFLGARVALGRWPHGEPPPRRDPLTHHVDIAERAIVRGVYDKVPGWPKLEAAEKEAEGFNEAWPGSALIDADYGVVRKLIRGEPPADLLHFAMHGQFADRANQNGLVLIRRDGEESAPLFLQPSQVRAAANGLKRGPFVFLNACQVGADQQVLGDHGGMSVAFLAIGAAAVVAPLWSVKDTVASAAAAGFYEAVLGADPVPVAEALRATRARFTEATITTPSAVEAATYLAYSFFGHPELTLSAKGS